MDQNTDWILRVTSRQLDCDLNELVRECPGLARNQLYRQQERKKPLMSRVVQHELMH
jgi:hypothetical protein